MSTIIVYGGNGALGRSIVTIFKSNKWNVISIDVTSNNEASHNIILPKDSTTLVSQGNFILNHIQEIMSSKKVDAIACVAGGWAGGNPGSNEFLSNASIIIQQSLWTSLIASDIAARFLKDNGLLILTGALAAEGPTPNMMVYGLIKSSIHHLVSSLSISNALPKGVKVCAILPVTLDTPSNRQFMSEADTSTWTPTEDIANKILEWVNNSNGLPNGRLVGVITENGKTKFQM